MARSVGQRLRGLEFWSVVVLSLGFGLGAGLDWLLCN